MKRNPKILWLADTPGWAYESIVRNVGAALPGYEHMLWYVMGGQPNDGVLLRQLCAAADGIVSMYVRYPQLLPAEYHAKVVLMLTGFRPFEKGV